MKSKPHYALILPLVRRQWFLLVVIVAGALIAFGDVLNNGFVVWDDPYFILSNLLLRTFDPKIWWTFDPNLYDPITLLVYQVLHFFFGFNPMAFHGVSLALHAANAVLIFFFLRRIITNELFCFLGSLLFAVH